MDYKFNNAQRKMWEAEGEPELELVETSDDDHCCDVCFFKRLKPTDEAPLPCVGDKPGNAACDTIDTTNDYHFEEK